MEEVTRSYHPLFAIQSAARCSSLQGVDSNRADATDQWIDVSFAAGVYAIAQKDDEQVPLRIDPDSRASKAAVAEGRRRHSLAAIAGIAGPHVPAQRPQSV